MSAGKKNLVTNTCNQIHAAIHSGHLEKLNRIFAGAKKDPRYAKTKQHFVAAMNDALSYAVQRDHGEYVAGVFRELKRSPDLYVGLRPDLIDAAVSKLIRQMADQSFAYFIAGQLYDFAEVVVQSKNASFQEAFAEAYKQAGQHVRRDIDAQIERKGLEELSVPEKLLPMLGIEPGRHTVGAAPKAITLAR